MTPETSGTARILDGKATAQAVRADVRARTQSLADNPPAGLGTFAPGLTVVLVGEDPASQVYVRNKDKAAREVGFVVNTVRLAADIQQPELLDCIRALNNDSSVHGILVQLPLPKGLDSDLVVQTIDPSKDVDGLHPLNVARLAMGIPGLRPCTPAGCIELLDRHGVPLEGAQVVILGRSMLVGKPMAALALERNATVTICHSRTRDLPQVVASADILVAAVGRPELVQGDWIREGATVLDVGINRPESPREDGRKLVGDVAFAEASQRAGAITPVPGGVGPMTIAMLLSNTLQAACQQFGVRAEDLANAS